ncbi:glycosyltransferase family 2 protein [Catellatospora bangladeshensis]|uniref:N-acetylglucosaminyltransferase n=1 Tax=Catellatospora bangladeshensis TaxID=310355 RepID=A0A8J3NL06_9ACTN|nr:glycosyltransferase family 2 protein [Catellatospora bangladeshensis]GIF82040.1 N-acetylglucosaminyltransferase [Catellatospora bangladeshensis]
MSIAPVITALTAYAGFAVWHARRQRSRARIVHTRAPAAAGPDAQAATAVDVIVCCHNEQPQELGRCLSALAGQRYGGELRVHLVDDGSHRPEEIEREFHRHAAAGWRLLRLPERRGKRLAQHAAFQDCSAEVIVSVDSDTVIDPGAITALVGALDGADVVAATGTVTIQPPLRTVLHRLLDMRYRLLHETGRAAHSFHDAVLCCGGALTAYRRSALLAVWPDYISQRFRRVACNHGEDMYLTLLLLRPGRATRFVPQASARTQAPRDAGDLLRQQLRWTRSYYRDFVMLLRIVRARPRYLLADVVAGELLPVMLLLSGASALLAGQGLLGWAAVVAPAALVVDTAVTVYLTGLGPALCLGYVVIWHWMSLPVRCWALLTLGNQEWGTRGRTPRT